MKLIATILLLGNLLKIGLAQVDPRCPLLNDPEFTVHLPHEYDCNLFYKCDWGKAVQMNCPPDLHFNPILEVCDWPQNAGCIGGESSSTTAQVTDTTNDGGVSDTTNDGGVSDTTNNQGDGTTSDNPVQVTSDSGRDPRCPADNGQWAVHLPHEYDCALFYKCDWGIPVLQECPPGLHFNPILEVCDWPQNAGCIGGESSSTTAQVTDTTNDGGVSDTTNNQGGDTTSDNPVQVTSDSGRDPRCPADNGQWAVHLPHEYDCALFYKCDWGIPVLQECPPGLHFNPILEVCDWPQNAGCIGGESSSTTAQVTDTTNDGGVSDTTNDGGVSDTTNNQGDGTTSDNPVQVTSDSGRDPRCPADNGQWAVHLPHEYDCALFYKCDWGIPVLQECPPGLHFNPILEVCDWPQNAGCIGGESSSTTAQVTDTTNDGGVSDTTNDGGVSDTTNNQGDGTTSDNPVQVTSDSGRDPRCPADNGQWAVHLPHEYDCALFYKCDWGIPVLQECPPGLHFNPILEVCDWPQNAGCIGGESSSTTAQVTDTTNDGGVSDTTNDGGVSDTTNNQGDGTTSDNPVQVTSDSGRDPRCPADNGQWAVHLPHEYDCALFYKCDWGIPVLQECPPGLHFNPILEVCDWPQNAGCIGGESSSTTAQVTDTTNDGGVSDTTNDGGVSDTTNNQGDGTTSDNPVQVTSDSGRDPRCPADNGQWAVHLPHEYDCALFYKCDWGIPVLQECPPGLHFNPILEVCDWPQNAGCIGGESSSTTAQVTDTTNDGGVSDTTNDGGVSDTTNNQGDGTTSDNPVQVTSDSGRDPRCPADNGQWAVHLPHEYDCALFYKCDWGIPVLQECPPGLHFNPILEVCDWPQNAGCTL